MSVTFVDFESFAVSLCSSQREIDWRMATARAYYASFHRAQLSTRFCPDNSHFALGSHERVTDSFKLQGSMPAKSIAYVLVGMKKLRNNADYELNDPYDKNIPSAQLATHRKLVERLNEFDQSFAAKSA